MESRINVFKSIVARAERRFIQPRSITLFSKTIECVDTTSYLGVDYIHESPVASHRPGREEVSSKEGNARPPE